ncbi:MAG: hypothetical protein K2P99_03170, partial [Burkholderiales bacterium]|nr:hypothetical protein [Burkholderiales bacterium]
MTNARLISTQIKDKAQDFGFLEAKIANIKIDQTTATKFLSWLAVNFHGDMDYLTKNIELRFNPTLLHNSTLSIICVKAPYLTKSISFHKQRLK